MLTSKIINVTYSELVNMISNSLLMKGQSYRITDFRTYHLIPNTSDYNTGPVEPLIVYGISSNQLDISAHSELFPLDIIHYEVVPTHIMSGPLSGSGDMGWIYYRKDTVRNLEGGYDWRKVKYRRWLETRDTSYNAYGINYTTMSGFSESTCDIISEIVNFDSATSFIISSNWKTPTGDLVSIPSTPSPTIGSHVVLGTVQGINAGTFNVTNIEVTEGSVRVIVEEGSNFTITSPGELILTDINYQSIVYRDDYTFNDYFGDGVEKIVDISIGPIQNNLNNIVFACQSVGVTIGKESYNINFSGRVRSAKIGNGCYDCKFGIYTWNWSPEYFILGDNSKVRSTDGSSKISKVTIGTYADLLFQDIISETTFGDFCGGEFGKLISCTIGGSCWHTTTGVEVKYTTIAPNTWHTIESNMQQSSLLSSYSQGYFAGGTFSSIIFLSVGSITINGPLSNTTIGVDLPKPTSITYNDLVTLISHSGLIKYTVYEINNFRTRNILDTDIYNEGGFEHLLVTATSTNTISTLVKSSNCDDIIYYSLSNINGSDRGHIYYRKELDRNIEAQFDWKSVLFRRYERFVEDTKYTNWNTSLLPYDIDAYITPDRPDPSYIFLGSMPMTPVRFLPGDQVVVSGSNADGTYTIKTMYTPIHMGGDIYNYYMDFVEAQSFAEGTIHVTSVAGVISKHMDLNLLSGISGTIKDIKVSHRNTTYPNIIIHGTDVIDITITNCDKVSINSGAYNVILSDISEANFVDNISNNIIEPRFSDFSGTKDITGIGASTKELNITDITYYGEIILTSTNSTEEIAIISGGNYEPYHTYTIMPEKGLAVTITATATPLISDGQIALSSPSIILDGDKAEFITITRRPGYFGWYQVR